MSNYLFNQDAETAVLSILLRNPDRIYGVIDELRDFMFSSQPSKVLYQEISDLAGGLGVVPEYNLLVNTLQAKKRFAECGGEDNLQFLYNLSLEDANLGEYTRQIINSYKARCLLSLSSEIPTMVTNEMEVDGVITRVRDQLDGLTVINGGDTVVDMQTATRITWEELLERVKSPNKIEKTTGFLSLDIVTGGYWSGDLWIVAGRPGMGKSAWMCNTILAGAKVGMPALVFSLEMPKQALIHRLLSIETGIPITNMRTGNLSHSQVKTVEKAIEELRTLPIYIDSNFMADAGYISSTIRKHHKLHGVQMVHLDYIQLLVERGIYATHELGRVSRELKLLSNNLGITSVVYSQLNRGVEMRDDKRPVLSDLRQSGNLEEDADVALFLYRDVVYNRDTKHKDEMENLIRKQRNGPTGMVPMKFDNETNAIREM